MAEVTLFTSPMARKKRVENRYHPNSYRVISQEAETWQREPTQLTSYTTTTDFNIIGQIAEPYVPFLEHRKNRPNPNHVGFLRQDVRLLNEPVCDVYTDCTKKEQMDWWPSRISNQPLKKSEHTLDTTVRGDFQYRGRGLQANGRHTANPNKEPAFGTAPVNFLRAKDGKQKFWKEGISYEHQYNCRLDPQYPIRGKRHGNFVWDQFPPHEVDRMLHHYGLVADKRQQTSANPTPAGDCTEQKAMAAPKSAVEAKVKPETPVEVAAPKTAHPAVRESPQHSAKAEQGSVEVVTGKPLSRNKTESVILASQNSGKGSDGLKLPPIAL